MSNWILHFLKLESLLALTKVNPNMQITKKVAVINDYLKNM